MKITKENAIKELPKAIIENQLTQKKVAEKTGLTEATISRIITGLHKPGGVTLYKLNSYIGIFYPQDEPFNSGKPC